MRAATKAARKRAGLRLGGRGLRLAVRAAAEQARSSAWRLSPSAQIVTV